MSAIPIDQVLIEKPEDYRVLMLPRDKYWLRTVDPDSKTIAKAKVIVGKTRFSFLGLHKKQLAEPIKLVSKFEPLIHVLFFLYLPILHCIEHG